MVTAFFQKELNIGDINAQTKFAEEFWECPFHKQWLTYQGDRSQGSSLDSDASL